MLFRWVALFLLCMVPALEGKAYADSVRERRTGISFPKELPDDYFLLGVGHRSKFGFRVYAAALYVHRDALPLLAESRHPLRELFRGTANRRVIQHFVRNAPGDKIQETFMESVQEVLTPEELKANASELKRLHDSMGTDAPRGTRVEIAYQDGSVIIRANNQDFFSTTHPVVMRAIFEVFFGRKPVSATLARDVRSRIQALKEASQQQGENDG